VKKNPLVETVLSTFPALPLPKGTEEGVWPSPNLALGLTRSGTHYENMRWWVSVSLRIAARPRDESG